MMFRNKKLTEGEAVATVPQDQDIITYKQVQIEHFPYQMQYGDETEDIDGWVIKSPYYIGGQNGKPRYYMPLYCEDEDGEVINFTTLDQAKKYIDDYIEPKRIKIRIKHGDEVHAVVIEQTNEDIDLPDNLFAYLPDGWWNRPYEDEDNKDFEHPWVGKEIKVEDAYYHPYQVIVARSKPYVSDSSDFIYTVPVDEIKKGNMPMNFNHYHAYDGYSWNQEYGDYSGDKGWKFTGKTYKIGSPFTEDTHENKFGKTNKPTDGFSESKGLKEDMELNFDRALLDKWIDDLNANGAKHHQTFSYTEGGKYIKVSYTYGGRYDTAVFAFVDADGNIYKPAGWKTPAKGVRARIDDNPPLDGKDLYSARYRAAVYGESVNEAYNKDSLHAKLWNMEHKEQTCFQNGYCVTCYFHDGEGMAKRFTVTNRDGKKVLDCNAGFAWQPQIQKFEDSLLQLLNTGSIKEEILTEKPSPAGYEPTKKGIAYKVFKVKNGKLYPPMVANAGGADTPIGVWLDAEEGEFAGLSKTGRPQVKSTGSGNLSYRPGWHLGDVPRAKQFDRLNKETGEYEFPKDFVWAECEYAMDVDYQPESDARGYERTKVDKDGNVITTKSDKYQHSLAGLPKLPTNGYYKYRTNPNPDTVPWVITGQMKVKRLLSDAEVNAILEKNGIEPIHRQGGDKTLAELGLKESVNEDFYNTGFDKIGLSQEEVNEFTHNLESAIQSNMGRMFKVNDVSLDGNTINVVVGAGKYEDDEPIYQSILPSKVKSEGIDSYIEPIVEKAIVKFADDNA